jgi:hypothetical protein
MARTRQHEPLRIPENWVRQDRSFVIQLERILDDIYAHMNNADAWRSIYPVGAVYTSVENKSPATLFGGTWESMQSSTGIYMWKRTE